MKWSSAEMWWLLGGVLVAAVTLAIWLLRPRRGLLCEPGEQFRLLRGQNVRVWDVFIGFDRGMLRVNGRAVDLAELPVVEDRYEICAGDEPNTAVVRIIPTPDAAFRAKHESFTSSDCTPVVSTDFVGIALAGPSTVSVAESIAEDWDDWVQHKVAHFVIAGRYTFTSKELATLDRDALDAIELVIENGATNEITRRTVTGLANEYRYEVLGINVSPAAAPPWVSHEPQPGFVSVGGCFHSPLGLFVGEPDTAFDLSVRAECGDLRSNTVVIRIEP